MELWLWAAVGVFGLAALLLLIKVKLLQKSADELCRALSARLAEDTNTLTDVSSRDRHILALASGINRQLRLLRAERQRYRQGDFELKAAMTNISHDLRTPLTAISGYLDLLERQEKSPEVSRYTAIIRERAEALQALTEELFRFSVVSAASDQLRLERVSLNGVLEESVAGFYAALTERGITPHLELPERPLYRELDRDALRRIYDNLLSNALKYSDGDLRISMGPDGETRFSNKAAALDTVSVQRLFDRFYTVETGRSASGLGLSIARLLTERMGGTIDALWEKGTLTVIIVFKGD